MYPDGGIARLKVFGVVVPNIIKHVMIDVASLQNGARALEFSNAHYGSPMRLLQLDRSLGMFDGWETARNPNRPHVYLNGDDGNLIIPGNEWAVIKLGVPSIVRSVVVDTLHYKGNFPESCEILGCLASDDFQEKFWTHLITRVKLGGHQEHFFDSLNNAPITHVKLIMYPDGGISRLRLMGTPI